MTLDAHVNVDQTSGEGVLELTVRRRDSEPVELQFTSGQSVAFVAAADDEELWRWSDGRMFSQALERERLETGDEMT